MIVTGWRAWYDTGVVYTSTTTSVTALPLTGIQVLALYFDQQWAPGKPYRRLLYGDDRYFLVHSGPNTGTWGQTSTLTRKQLEQQYGRTNVAIWDGVWIGDAAIIAMVEAAIKAEASP